MGRAGSRVSRAIQRGSRMPAGRGFCRCGGLERRHGGSVRGRRLSARRGPPPARAFWERRPPELESTVRYSGIEVDDAIEIAEQIEV